jgi:NTE family protein
MTKIFKKDLGISLAGGGIKAYSQIGVLQYLEEIGLSAQGFSGTSMGSLIAAFLACGLDAATIKEYMLELEEHVITSKLLKPSNAQFFPLIKNDANGLINPSKFVEILQKQLDKCNVKTFKDLKYPLIVNAVDLNTGKIVLFTNQTHNLKKHNHYVIIDDANLIDALQASCSFPMVFETMIWNDYQLVDGGVLMNAPVLPLKQSGFDYILSITMGIKNDYKTTTRIFDIAGRVMEIMINEADAMAIEHATYNLNVFEKEIGIFSMGKGADAIDLGYKIAKEHHEELMKLKEKKGASLLDFFK